MADRGEYRAIHVALIDDPDFLQLSPPARLALMTLKLILGVSGIDVVRALVPELMATTGYDEATIRAAVDELTAGRWILIEGRVVWLRNGLRFEPSKPLASENGRKGISAHLETLPRVALVNRFADYYGLPRPFPELDDPADSEGATEPPSNPLPTPSEPPTEAGMRDEGRGIYTSELTTTRAHAREEPGSDPAAIPDADPAAPVVIPFPGASEGLPSPEEQASRAIMLANRGMRENPAIGEAYTPIPPGHSSRQVVLDWIAEGISWEAIQAAVYETARTYRPQEHRRQITTMRYFDGPVREEHARRLAAQEPAPKAGRTASASGRGRQGRATPRPPEHDYSHPTETPEEIAWSR